MLTKENFNESHIRMLQKQSKKDPALLERAVFAFGLLEAIRRVEMPFIFKGGTCPILLLKHPMRLSTDIDIIVAPDTDVDTYISKASTIFPFKQYEEQVRIGKNSIEKRHFKFTYQSPITGKDIYILLDILFAENPYTKVVDCEIRNDLLLTEPEYLLVKTPDINCILGDKLTAFAPHTTGIPLNVKKDMEVMKQMYDVGALLEHENARKQIETITLRRKPSLKMGRFFCAIWPESTGGSPCFGYQGGYQQPPAIPPEKSELSHGNFETKYPKAIVVPAHLYIGALVVSRVSGRVQQGVVCLYVLRPIRSTKANMDGCALRHFVPKVRGETVAQ